MKKKNLKLSNKAHKRLAKKHDSLYKKTGNSKNWICTGYHNSAADKQKQLGRVLTTEEKKRLFKVCEFYWYN